MAEAGALGDGVCEGGGEHAVEAVVEEAPADVFEEEEYVRGQTYPHLRPFVKLRMVRASAPTPEPLMKS